MDKEKVLNIYRSLSADERSEMQRLLEYDYLKEDIDTAVKQLPSKYHSVVRQFLKGPAKERCYKDIINRFYDDNDSDLSHWQNIEGAIMSFLDSRSTSYDKEVISTINKKHNNEHER